MSFPHPDTSVILLFRLPKTSNNPFLEKADALEFLLLVLLGGRQPWQLPHPWGSASPRSGDQSHPSPITVGSGCQLHDTPPTHPARETLCIHQASPERHTAIWKAQRCQTANVLAKRRQWILQTPQRMRGRPREERPGRNQTKEKEGESRYLGNSRRNGTAFFLVSKRGILLGWIQLHWKQVKKVSHSSSPIQPCSARCCRPVWGRPKTQGTNPACALLLQDRHGQQGPNVCNPSSPEPGPYRSRSITSPGQRRPITRLSVVPGTAPGHAKAHAGHEPYSTV